MADETYDLPQIVAVALQTQRGELLKALGPMHADQLLKGMSQDTCVQLLNLIADLIDDRFKLKRKAHEHAVMKQQAYAQLVEAQCCIDNLRAIIIGDE